MADKPNQFRSLIKASGQMPALADSTKALSPSSLAGPTIVEPLSGQKTVSGRQPGKRSSPFYTQVGAYIPRDLHNKVKMRLLQDQDERDFSDLIEDLLKRFISQGNSHL